MNRVQSLKSALAGVRPVTGTRQPGELYTNFPDMAFGVIDITQTAVDLIAVRFWSSLANYSVGSFVIHNGNLYTAIVPVTAGAFNPAQWGSPGGGVPEAPLDGTAYARKSAAWAHLTHADITDWTAATAAATAGFLPLVGGILTGQLTIAQPSGTTAMVLKKISASQDALVVGRNAGGSGNGDRWYLTLGDGSPESGSNAGSNFSIEPIADDGSTAINTALFITRSTGLVTLAGDPTVALGAATKAYVDAHSGIPEAPSGGVLYGRKIVTGTGQWAAAAPEAPNDGQLYGRKSLGWTVVPSGGGGIPEAPLDGQQYGRQSAAWTVVATGAGIPDAPNDGQQYGRQSLGWTVVASGGGIPDAPNDGTAYARKSAAWAHLTHTDITDWTATLAPYALTTALSAYLPLTGGTVSGQINTPAPTVGSNAANKTYVDTAVASVTGSAPNLIDNGDMSVFERNSGTLAVGSGTHWLVDRWASVATASRFTMGQNYNGLAPPTGFARFLGAQCTSATAPGSTDFFAFQQGIEGATLNGFNWGSGSAQPATLSFWACSDQTGTFSGAINNAAGTRTFVFTFALVAGTPAHFTILIPGDTAGTWINTGQAVAMWLLFNLGSGTSELTGTVGSWVAGSFIGATGSAGIIGHNGAKFYVTGVKLEQGNVATPFAYDSPAVRQVRCARYFQILGQVSCDGYGGQGFMTGVQTLLVEQRSGSQSTSLSGVSYTNANGFSVLGTGTNTIVVGANCTGTGDSNAYATIAISAEI